jgi:hypothetical protein
MDNFEEIRNRNILNDFLVLIEDAMPAELHQYESPIFGLMIIAYNKGIKDGMELFKHKTAEY